MQISRSTMTLVIATSIVACNSDEDPHGDTDASGADTATATDGIDPNAPTYYDDVLPILIRNCVGCHTQGGIAPFVISDWEHTKPWGPAMADATTARIMPPFPMDNSGKCNTYRDARWLSEGDIATIRAWVEGGMPEGDPDAPRPDLPAPDQLVGNDVQDLVTPDYQPVPSGDASAKFDDYHCFPLEVGPETDRFLLGYEVMPGNAAIVHHAVGFKVDPARVVSGGVTNQTIMTLLDNQSEAPGWSCFGAAGEGIMPEGTPITWAPGGGAMNFPDGTGIRFKPGEIIVLQMHYNLINDEGSDQTTVRLSWADTVEREGFQSLNDRFLATAFGGAPAELEPGKESVVYSWNARLNTFISGISELDQIEVLAILPHMHERGRRMQITLQDSTGTEQCAGYVDRWDFNWQAAYFYETPLVASPLDKVEVICEWNTSGVDAPVTPGFGTQNEMCLIGMYVAAKK